MSFRPLLGHYRVFFGDLLWTKRRRNVFTDSVRPKLYYSGLEMEYRSYTHLFTSTFSLSFFLPLSLFLSLSGSLSHSPTVCYLLPSMFHLTIFRDETGRRCLKVYLLYYLFVFILSSSTTHQTCFRVPQRLANYGKIILCLPLHHWPLVIWVVDLGSIQFKFMDL